MLPINLLVIGYMIISSGYIAISRHPRRGLFLFINGLILMWFCAISLNHVSYPAFYGWSGLLCLPLLYHETAITAQRSNKTNHDSAFIAFENIHFPSIMAFHHQNRANHFWLSEYLHACYLGFYVFIYGTPLYFYLRHEMLFFEQCTFAILLTILSCYITHALIPVLGPRTIFTQITDHRSHGLFFKWVHRILSKGSSPGTAFPSGHTGVASIVLLITWHLHTPLFYALLPVGLGLIISTIYGRFHYVSDVIVGMGYAMIAFLVTLTIYD